MQKEAIRGIAFAADGNLVSAGENGRINLWKGANGPLLRSINHGSTVESVDISADGKAIASAGRDAVVRLWSAATGKPLGVLEGHKSIVLRVRFAPDGKTLASSGADRTIRLWDVATRKQRHVLEGHEKEARGLAFAKDGRTLASGSVDNTVRLWDVAKGRPLPAPPAHTAPVYAVRVLADNKTVVTVGRDHSVRWWDIASGKPLRTQHDPRVPERGAAFSPHGDVLALGTAKGEIRLLNSVAGAEIVRFPVAKMQPRALAFSPDGRRIVAVSAQASSIWDAKTHKNIAILPGEADPAPVAILSGADTAFVASKQGGGLYDASGKSQQRRLSIPFPMTSASFSPDDRLLLWGDLRGAVHVWDVARGQELRKLPGLAGYVQSLTFAPDARSFAAGAWHGIVVWETATGLERCRFTGTHGDTLALAFAPDGRRLVSGNSDTTALVWDLTAGLANRKNPTPLDELWTDLAKSEAAAAYRAMWQLAGRPAEAVPLFAKHLKPAVGPSEQQIAKLVRDLDSDDFDTRQGATHALTDLDDTAEPLLRKR